MGGGADFKVGYKTGFASDLSVVRTSPWYFVFLTFEIFAFSCVHKQCLWRLHYIVVAYNIIFDNVSIICCTSILIPFEFHRQWTRLFYPWKFGPPFSIPAFSASLRHAACGHILKIRQTASSRLVSESTYSYFKKTTLGRPTNTVIFLGPSFFSPAFSSALSIRSIYDVCRMLQDI